MTPDLHPDAERLQLHLREQLPVDQADAIEAHLGDCQTCQSRIESMAAEQGWWQALPSCLSDPEMASSRTTNPGLSTASPDELWFVENQQIQKILAPTDDPSKIGRLGSYEVVGIVGAGATAVVLKALDGALNRFVAIKLLRPTLAASAIARQRFAREARAAASIVHENVIEIHGVSEVDGLPYLVMPYVRGESLSKRIERSWPLSTEAMLHIACQVADGLAAAHDKGLIHRDVKPSNILLGDGVERLKLTDFGLARAVDDVGLTRSGTLAGTPEYMSPEQARGNSIDHRTDLFSLGSVLYAMCTGRPPFSSDSCYGVLRRIVEEQPRPIREFNPEVPDWLCQFIQRLMEKDRDQRLDSATTVATKSRQCLNHLRDPHQSLPDDLRPRKNRFPKPMMIGLIVSAGISLPILAAAMMWTVDQTDSPPVAPRSAAEVTTSLRPPETWEDGVGAILDDVGRQLAEFDELLPPTDSAGNNQ
ncbi:serine/threonine protein kinase [Stieleria sp. TO1_6]|uniref:serine/threonine-protein kinase n=1 Tax=Stieleria tagensis TaxID=2956795 RepID=UPI00209B6335|nr:serine/threonine-protein kinase [Stieleria tagensis]MCO8125208.1 serine/threonine protein kinase [Stieleria tagensis]